MTPGTPRNGIGHGRLGHDAASATTGSVPESTWVHASGPPGHLVLLRSPTRPYPRLAMRCFVSAYGLGDDPSALLEVVPPGAQTLYFANALDHIDPDRRTRFVQGDLQALRALELDVRELDLRDYFGAAKELGAQLSRARCLFGSGGNVYVLRRAMALSGFDHWLTTRVGSKLVYAGYSAAICVLSPRLDGYDQASDPNINPYDDHPAMLAGLGLIDWACAPHAGSKTGEGAQIAQEMAAFERKGIAYRALPNGETFVTELHAAPRGVH